MRLVFRDFPLPNHQEAFAAAVAAQCADAQGQFWEFHDKLFANQSALQPEHLKRYAAEMDLDAERFNGCLEAGEHDARVRTDIEEGQSYGVTGTPAFFINGRFLSGAQPYDAFSDIIDDELERLEAR